MSGRWVNGGADKGQIPNPVHKIVARQRIETSFVEQLNEYAIENFKFGIMKLDRSKYVVFRTSDKFFREDPYKPEDEDNKPA